MNRKALYALLVAGLIGVFGLVACNDKDGTGTETGTGTGTGTGTSATTAADTEAETAIPRYDYLEADVSADVTIEKADYTGLTLTIPNSLKVTDEAIDAYIKSVEFNHRIADNGSEQVKDKALKLGDDAYIYYKGFLWTEETGKNELTGEENTNYWKEFSGGSNWTDTSPFQLGLGSGSFIPGFEEQLVGVVPSSTSKANKKVVKLEMTFPEDYSKDDLAGKKVMFAVAVDYSVGYTLPTYERTEEVRAQYEAVVRQTLLSQMASSVEDAKTEALWEHLLAKVECRNLPELELDYYVSSYKSEVEYYYNYYGSSGGDEFKKLYPTMGDFAVVFFGLDEGASWETEVKAMAEKMVKKDMILHAIGEAEGFEAVSDAEYKEQLDYWVEYYSGYMTESEVVESMGETILRRNAYAERATEWLFEQATFTYADGSAIEEVEEKDDEA